MSYTYEIEFETLKERAKAELSGRMRNIIGGLGGQDHYTFDLLAAAFSQLISMKLDVRRYIILKQEEMMREWEQKAHQVIDNWDIRCVRKLIDLFPATVNHRTKISSITVDCNDDGNWVVIFHS